MKLNLTQEQLASVGRGAMVAAIGAALTYVVQSFGEIDFGSLAPLATAVLSVAVNYVRKLNEQPVVVVATPAPVVEQPKQEVK